jgi:hypothetical protein
MTTEVYEIGAPARLTAAFTVDGTATDPSTVSLAVREPDGTETTKTHAAGEVTKDGTGNYHFDWPVAKAGRHHWTFTGTGNAADVQSGEFWARPKQTGAG